MGTVANRLRVIIDGGYLFNTFKPYREQGYRYSPRRLQRVLSRDYNLVGVHLVDGINDRNPVTKARQEAFFAKLRADLGWDVQALPLQWPGGEARQKGTDSAITLLIYRSAVENKCDTIALLASDADFCEPVREAVEEGKVVRNAYFTIQPSWHLQQACNGAPIRLDDLDFVYHVDNPRQLVTPRSIGQVVAPHRRRLTVIRPSVGEPMARTISRTKEAG